MPSILGVLGLLAHTMGRLAAEGHFDDTLLQRNDPGDRERAVSLLDGILAISRELGLRPLMQRVLSRRDILKLDLP